MTKYKTIDIAHTLRTLDIDEDDDNPKYATICHVDEYCPSLFLSANKFLDFGVCHTETPSVLIF